jgi:sigma-B regulation protein RsbU (phosphoserine phosphatase)
VFKTKSLRKKLTFAALCGSLLFILGFAVFSPIRNYFLLTTIDDIEKNNLFRITSRAEEQALKEEKRRLTNLNESVSELLSTELEQITEDVALLRDTFENFLEQPEKYKERILPNALYKDVISNVPYVHYSQRLLKEGLTPQIEKEVRIASNIADFSPFYSDYYNCIFFGSERGYSIGLYVMDHQDDLVPVSTEPSRTTYDPVTRIWYQNGKKFKEPSFTDIYLAQSGDMVVSCISPYYVNGEFRGVMGVDCNPNKIYELVKSIAVEESELYFILSPKGEILFVNFDSDALSVSLGKDIRNSEEKSLAEVAKYMTAQKSGFESVTIKGKDYFIAYSPVKKVNWSFASLIPVEKVYAPAKDIRQHLTKVQDQFYEKIENFIVIVAASTLGFVLLLLFVIFKRIIPLSDSVVKPILELTRSVNEFASGDLDKRVDFKSKDEIQNIGDNFNSLAQRLQDTIRDLSVVSAEKMRLDAEINVVNEILVNYLPDDFSIADKHNFDLFAVEYPAKTSGGDYFDFFMLDDDHMAISVGDVSGRGVPSALFMMISKSVIKSFSKMNPNQDLGSLFTMVNDRLHKHNTEKMYVAVFFGVIELSSGRMKYVNAGHFAPYIFRDQSQTGNFLMDESIDPIMALTSDATFRTRETVINPGDIVFMYTDGITTELSNSGEKFDEDMLTDAVFEAAKAGMSSKEIVEASRKAAVEFAGHPEFNDDIALLCLKRKK